MKLKVLFLSVLAAVCVYSCSTDREEQTIENPASEKKLDVKKIKINNRESGEANKVGSDSASVVPIASPSGGSQNPGFSIDPNDGSEIIPPGDVKPPKK